MVQEVISSQKKSKWIKAIRKWELTDQTISQVWMNSTKVIEISMSIPEQTSITYHLRFFNHHPLLLIIIPLDRITFYAIILLVDIELTGIIGRTTLPRILEICHPLVIFISNCRNFIYHNFIQWFNLNYYYFLRC